MSDNDESQKLEQDFGKATGMKVVNTPSSPSQEGRTEYAAEKENEKR